MKRKRTKARTQVDICIVDEFDMRLRVNGTYFIDDAVMFRKLSVPLCKSMSASSPRTGHDEACAIDGLVKLDDRDSVNTSCVIPKHVHSIKNDLDNTGS